MPKILFCLTILPLLGNKYFETLSTKISSSSLSLLTTLAALVLAATDSISAPILTKPLTQPYPHPVTATVPSFMLEPTALTLPLTYSDVLTKTGLVYTLSLATVAPTIPAFPVIGPNNF
jgi:hypothetical protein